MNASEDYVEGQGAGPADPGEKKTLSRKTRLVIGISASAIIIMLGIALPLLMASPGQLSLTVFSNDWSEVTLKPGIETPLNEYLSSDSSVPGFPLRASYPGAGDILLSVDAGTLFTWGAPDYIAVGRGMSYAVESGGTVYWSPNNADNTLVPQCTLTVSGRQGGQDAAQLRLILRQSGTGYSITLLSGE